MQVTKQISVIAPVTVATDKASSTEIAFEEFTSGFFQQISGTLATITWYVALRQSNQDVGQGPSPNVPAVQTFQPAYKQDGTTALTTPTQVNRSIAIPAELAGAAAIKAQGDAAGVINVCLKS